MNICCEHAHLCALSLDVLLLENEVMPVWFLRNSILGKYKLRVEKKNNAVTSFIWLPLKSFKPFTSAGAGWSSMEVFSNHMAYSFRSGCIPLFLQVFVTLANLT